MGRYGTREAEVDRLLREGVLVDLLRVVRQSLRASVESYSIKKMEAFYGFVREIDLRDAGSSIVAFEQWLELGEGERPAGEPPRSDRALQPRRRRQQPRGCATGSRALRDELARADRPRGPAPGRAATRRAAGRPDREPRPASRRSSSASPARMSCRPTRRSDAERSRRRWLLAQLLGWHRREDKSMWWEFHRLMDLTPEQLVDEDDPIGLLEPDRRRSMRTKKGKQTWRYRFPAQDYDLGRGEVYDPANKQARPDDNPVQVGGRRRSSAVDPASTDRRPASASVDEPHPRAIVPLDWVRTKDHQAALYDLGAWVADHGIQAAGPDRAGARPAVPAAAARRAMARRGAPPRRANPTSRRRAGSAVVARPHDARDPGATRLGQDLHRGADDLLAAGRRQAGRHHRRRATRSSATC